MRQSPREHQRKLNPGDILINLGLALGMENWHPTTPIFTINVLEEPPTLHDIGFAILIDRHLIQLNIIELHNNTERSPQMRFRRCGVTTWLPHEALHGPNRTIHQTGSNPHVPRQKHSGTDTQLKNSSQTEIIVLHQLWLHAFFTFTLIMVTTEAKHGNAFPGSKFIKLLQILIVGPIKLRRITTTLNSLLPRVHQQNSFIERPPLISSQSTPVTLSQPRDILTLNCQLRQPLHNLPKLIKIVYEIFSLIIGYILFLRIYKSMALLQEHHIIKFVKESEATIRQHP